MLLHRAEAYVVFTHTRRDGNTLLSRPVQVCWPVFARTRRDGNTLLSRPVQVCWPVFTRTRRDGNTLLSRPVQVCWPVRLVQWYDLCNDFSGKDAHFMGMTYTPERPIVWKIW